MTTPVPDLTWSRRASARRLQAILASERLNQVGLGTALMILVVVISRESPFFLTEGNILNIGRAIAITGIIAAVTTMVLVAGELDLSIGAVMAIGGIAAAKALEAGAPVFVVIIVGLAVGFVCGLVNALLVVGIGVNALIATIGTQFVWRGLSFIWTEGVPVPTFENTGFAYLGQGEVRSIPVSVIVLVASFVVISAIMSLTKFGSHIYSIGGSRDASRLSGVPVMRVRVAVYVLSGIAAAVAGTILASANGSANAISGSGVELTIIGAVILGGTALIGGRGSVLGTLLGIIFLGALANGMNLIGLAAYWQIFIQGLVLIIAVTIDELVRKRLGS